MLGYNELSDHMETNSSDRWRSSAILRFNDFSDPAIVSDYMETSLYWDSAACITYSTNYKQRLTLESWLTNLEPEPLNRSQQLPAAYKRLIQNLKQMARQYNDSNNAKDAHPQTTTSHNHPHAWRNEPVIEIRWLFPDYSSFWLRRWPPLRPSKRQSPTVLLKTIVTWTIYYH